MPTHIRDRPPEKSLSAPSSKPQKPFDFPTNQHLLITTPSYIFAWDTLGLKTVFSSSKAGIVAAKEAKDGSGILAVADRHVVVLQDTNRGQEKSWGLEADGDEVRQLEYTANSRDLYLTTKLTGSVQRYSTEHARLFNPPSVHNSPPVALSISPTGHILLSASEDPPSIYIKNLAHNSAPVLLQPRASDGPVCVAGFHPERANIFFLGFANGTLAAYDATRIMKRQHGKYANQEHANHGEIARFTEMHRPTSKGGANAKSVTITGAAFLPGYKTRAISVGSDGRCRLVDFADGGITLRTWHAKAPLTSVSVMSMKEEAVCKPTPYARRKRPGEGLNMIGGPTSTNNLIAVGRADGKVLVYDSLGILLTQKRVSVQGEKVLGVEWSKGPSPSPVAPSLDGRDPSEALSASLPSLASQSTPRRASHPTPASKRTKSTFAPGLGLPVTLRHSTPTPTPVATRRFTIHPDERDEAEAEGTVRRNPSPKRTDAAARDIGGNDFHDLFSPVKPQAEVMPPANQRMSPTRARPRLSSNTFVKDRSLVTDPPVVFSPKLTLLDTQPDTTTTETYQVSTEESPRTKSARRVSKRESPLNTKRRRSSVKPAAYASAINTAARLSGNLSTNHNATILANLRQLNTNSNAPITHHPAPLFARKHVPSTSTNPHPTPTHPFETQRTSPPKSKNKRATGYRLRRIHWQTDSVQSSLTDADEDIWLTSQSEREMRPRRTRSRVMEQPPARKSSRSRGEGEGGVSTVATAAPEPPSEVFVPSAREIQTFFPRGSSLSPLSKNKDKDKNKNKEANGLADQPNRPVLSDLPKDADPTTTRDPWTKARTRGIQAATGVKTDAEAGVAVGVAVTDTGTLGSVESHCAACSRTSAKMHGLEEEVAKLRGEVLGLRLALRGGRWGCE